ncbi:hypothetical protein KP509_26G046600 [Ceratopteris richardii]|uniref:RanBP2-type domain-containing protein n=1 Tax=Ceratopteris richardii TaxID=49495 RepID=A0A8T2RN07_CERRI|nr:hypothetical protein KP509_26G046600 [Ceratopteris richardii]
MALVRRMRLMQALRRSITYFQSNTSDSQVAYIRGFSNGAEQEAGNFEALTLENLGFGDNYLHNFGLEPKRVVSPEGDKRQQKRIHEKSPRTNATAAYVPSAAEMKQAALEASYILAGIAGMQLPKRKKLVVSEAAHRNSRGKEQHQWGVLEQQEADVTEEEEEDEIEKEEQDSAIKPETTTSSSPGLSNPPQLLVLNHPWPEWIEFLTDLHEKGYFEGCSEEVDEGKHLFQTYSAVKHATHAFGRTHAETFNCLNRKDLRVLANFGCPDVERKASNASKRLRAHFRIPEGDVCKQCRFKMTCPRAFLAPEANLRTNTLDITRIITAFATNVWADADSPISYPAEVGTSVCNLLKEFLTFKVLPIKLAEDNVTTERTSLLEPEKGARKKVISSSPVEMKDGDWVCPNCEYLNFNRNRRCKECNVFRPQQMQNAYIGDWHCPECRYLNFSKNRYCRSCNVERPTKMKWMGGERLPDDECPTSVKLPNKEREYEASDDGEVSDVSLTTPDEVNHFESEADFSEEEEKALSKGLSHAARRLSKANFRWDEVEELEKSLFGLKCRNKALEIGQSASKSRSGNFYKKH